MPIGCNVSINNTEQKNTNSFFIADVSGTKDISIKKDYKIDTSSTKNFDGFQRYTREESNT